MWPAIIGGAAALGGAAIGALGQSSANEANRQEAERQRLWSQNQGDTSRQFTREVMRHQIEWQMKDLKDAGLNPMLAVGKGASPGAGQTNQGGTAAVAQNVGAGLGASAQAAADFWRNVKKTNSEIDVNKALEKKAENEAVAAGTTARRTAIENRKEMMMMPAYKNQAEAEEKHSKFNKDAAHVDMIMRRLNPFSSAYKNFVKPR